MKESISCGAGEARGAATARVMGYWNRRTGEFFIGSSAGHWFGSMH